MISASPFEPYLERSAHYPGIDRSSLGRCIVAIDPRYLRPAEVDTLLGDASKARAKLGWAPRVRFRELVAEMAQEDLREAERGRLAMKQVPSGGPRLR